MFIHTICYVYTHHMLCFSASPFIHTIYSSHADGHPSLTLICNTTQATHQSIESTSFRWLLPDGSARYGRILVIDNVTLQHSGKYVCITKQTIDGEKMSASSSTVITAGNNYCFTKGFGIQTEFLSLILSRKYWKPLSGTLTVKTLMKCCIM